MKAKIMIKTIAAAALLTLMAGCSTWDSMSTRQQGGVAGAGIGGVIGAAVTDGGILGTVGGAAIGGIIGDQVGKRQ